jgi:nucleoporin NDC1
LTPEQQKILQPEYISTSMLQLVQSALRTPLGVPFRQTFAARARAKALGTPHSELDVVSYAIGAVARLAAASVQEDTFGTVHRDVAAILRALARVTGEVQTFVRMGHVHWTDVGFNGSAATATAGGGARGGDAARHVQEVEALLTHLRCALTFLIASFEGYAKDMGLGEVELREARKAAGLEV